MLNPVDITRKGQLERPLTWNSCTCFCCSDCSRPIVLKNSPTVDSIRSFKASARAFPKKKASKTLLLSLSPAKFSYFSFYKYTRRKAKENKRHGSEGNGQPETLCHAKNQWRFKFNNSTSYKISVNRLRTTTLSLWEHPIKLEWFIED